MSSSNVRARDLPPLVFASIQALIDYNAADEARDFERQVRHGEIEPDDERHIYTHIKRVQAWLSLNY